MNKTIGLTKPSKKLAAKTLPPKKYIGGPASKSIHYVAEVLNAWNPMSVYVRFRKVRPKTFGPNQWLKFCIAAPHITVDGKINSGDAIEIWEWSEPKNDGTRWFRLHIQPLKD
jgi:hypothetical protein